MLSFFKEIYLTGFTIFFKVGSANWTHGINIGKGVTGVAMVEWLILIGIASQIDALIGTRSLLDIPKWTAIFAFLVLCAANHYVLVVCRHGIVFEREFTNLKKSRRILLVAACAAITLVAIAFFISAAQAHRKLLIHS